MINARTYHQSTDLSQSMSFTRLVRIVDVGVKYLTLFGVPLSLIYLGQLAILLGLADYVFYAFFNCLRGDISIK
jgi:hypothetical protein